MREKILKVYGIVSLLGIFTGAVGSCFQLATTQLTNILKALLSIVSRYPVYQEIIAAVLSMMMVLLAWFLVRCIAPEASGSGVQEIEGALLHTRPIFWRRLLPVKFVGGVLSISANMVVGREGPTIQMGGNLGAMLAEWFLLKPNRRDAMISAGAAAGLATAFNAPLAGILFIVEEMRNAFHFNFTNFKMVAICCMMATITNQLIMGTSAALPMMIFSISPSLDSLWAFFILGLVVGFAGLFFNKALMYGLRVTDRISYKQRVIYVAIVGLLVGFFSVHNPALVGGGYEIIHQSLFLPTELNVLILLFVFRFIATMFCYTTNVPGGIFAPLLALGTLLGLVCYYSLGLVISLPTVHPGMFAVAGMGALFAATIRAPLTGIVLVVEMTQNYSLILPLMVSCLTSTTVVQLAKNAPIYTQLLRRTLTRSADHPQS